MTDYISREEALKAISVAELGMEYEMVVEKVIGTRDIGRTLDGHVARESLTVTASDVIRGDVVYAPTVWRGFLGDVHERTNCPNCGAPVDRGRFDCAYCGTRY